MNSWERANILQASAMYDPQQQEQFYVLVLNMAVFLIEVWFLVVIRHPNGKILKC